MILYVRYECFKCVVAHNFIQQQELFAMSQQKEIEAMFKISEVLKKAFEEVHAISGQLLKKAEDKKEKEPKTPKPETPKQQPQNSKKEKTETEKPKEKPVEKAEKTEKAEKVEKPKADAEEKASKKTQKQEKTNKKKHNPDRPKHPTSGYIRFLQANMEKIKQEFPTLSITELTTVTGRLWSQLNAEEKKPYEDAYKKEKAEYDLKMQKYLKDHPEEKSLKQQKLERKQEKSK